MCKIPHGARPDSQSKDRRPAACPSIRPTSSYHRTHSQLGSEGEQPTMAFQSTVSDIKFIQRRTGMLTNFRYSCIWSISRGFIAVRLRSTGGSLIQASSHWVLTIPGRYLARVQEHQCVYIPRKMQCIGSTMIWRTGSKYGRRENSKYCVPYLLAKASRFFLSSSGILAYLADSCLCCSPSRRGNAKK